MPTHQKIILVTGASSGMGAATARRLAHKGVLILVHARDEGRGRDVVEQIEASGGAAELLLADVSDPEQVESMFETIRARHGRLDVAVNNAGVSDVGPLTKVDRATFDHIVATNLGGVFWCMQGEIDLMEPGGGVIVNTASIGAKIAFHHHAIYCATKGAVLALSRAAAFEYGSRGIRINVLIPGIVETNMTADLPDGVKRYITSHTPLKRFGKPAELANAIAWLTSDESSFMLGQELVVDGGYTIH